MYLLDTNTCIFFFRGRFGLGEKLEAVGTNNCCISEITIAELKYGVENSEQVEKNRTFIQEFQGKFKIIPIFKALDVYAEEKARLRKAEAILDDFDLLIGATAVAHDLVSGNKQHQALQQDGGNSVGGLD